MLTILDHKDVFSFDTSLQIVRIIFNKHKIEEYDILSHYFIDFSRENQNIKKQNGKIQMETLRINCSYVCLYWRVLVYNNFDKIYL